jgi:hypothetical protein
MRRLILVLLAAPLLFSANALAQQVTISGATMTWYGAYQPGKVVVTPDANTPSGNKQVQSQLTPPQKNFDQIPLAVNTSFGFGYVLHGTPANIPITIRHVRKVPPPGVTDAKTGQPSFTIATTIRVSTDRTDLFIGQNISDVATMPTGPWTLQVWYNDKLLLEKGFVVLK